YSSLFSLLTERLNLSNASAYRRITAARLVSRIPCVLPHLQSGRVSLTKLCLVKNVLTADNAPELLSRIAKLGEREGEQLAMPLAPGPLAPARGDSIRPLPVSVSPNESPQGLFSARSASGTEATQVTETSSEPVDSVLPAEVRHLLKMTVGPEF